MMKGKSIITDRVANGGGWSVPNVWLPRQLRFIARDDIGLSLTSDGRVDLPRGRYEIRYTQPSISLGRCSVRVSVDGDGVLSKVVRRDAYSGPADSSDSPTMVYATVLSEFSAELVTSGCLIRCEMHAQLALTNSYATGMGDYLYGALNDFAQLDVEVIQE